MATSSSAAFRFSFGVNFASQEDKDAFLQRLCEARRVLKQPDNTALLSAILDLVLATPSPATRTGPTVASSFMETNRCNSPGPMGISNRSIYSIL